MKLLRLLTAAIFAVLLVVAPVLAQYRGAPVKKDRLIKALKSKQLQTRDIVAVILSNGVDFELNDETRRALIAAGARPEVLRAVAQNFRPMRPAVVLPEPDTGALTELKPPPPTYDELIERGTFSFQDKVDAKNAMPDLQNAARLDPKRPEAFQMLGFAVLYAYGDLYGAEKLMRVAVNNGGSAVFRVFHDDSGGFSQRCSGSLYISPDSIRFESDDNRHTFETATVNVENFTRDTESNREWRRRPVFSIHLRFGKEKTEFRFATETGSANETAMVERFIYIARNNITFINPR